MKKAGFTLLELAIVITIIGLIMGGVILGKSLIRNSQVNAVIEEYQRYRSAIVAFRDKYQALPGDFSRATTFWGAANSDPATCRTTATPADYPNKTCNGDGNGYIADADSAIYNEQFRAWQQLRAAGFIDGIFMGVTYSAGGTNFRNPGYNIPTSKIPKAGWGISSYTQTELTTPANSTIPLNPAQDQIPGVILWFGGQTTACTADGSGAGIFTAGDTQNGMLNGIESKNIDTKIDDGDSLTGKVKLSSCGGGTSLELWMGANNNGNLIAATGFTFYSMAFILNY